MPNPTLDPISQINQHFKDASDRLWNKARMSADDIDHGKGFDSPVFPNPHVIARTRWCECGAELGPDEVDFCKDCV